MANSGGSYVIENGKKRLVSRTRSATGANRSKASVTAETPAKSETKNTEEQVKA